MAIIDDTEIDGAQAAQVTVHVENWTEGTGVLSVLDNEVLDLTVTLPNWVQEGDSV